MGIWTPGKGSTVLLSGMCLHPTSSLCLFLGPDCPETVDQVGLKLTACLTFQTAVTEGMCHHLALKRFFWGMVVVLCVELGILGKHFTPDLPRLSLLFFPFPIYLCFEALSLCQTGFSAIVDDPELSDPPAYPHFGSAGFIGIHHRA